jgi:hypothetical protein
MKLYYQQTEVKGKTYTTAFYNALMKMKIENVYLSDGKEPLEKGIFFILVDMNTDGFSDRLKVVQAHSNYMNHYLVGTNDSPMCMIMIKSFGGRMIEKFLESKYSEMFDSELLMREDIKKLFDKDTIDYYNVLVKDEELMQNVANSLDIDINKLRKGELASKINKEEETYDNRLQSR